MRAGLRIPDRICRPVRRHLLGSSNERMAYLPARASRWTDPWGHHTTDLLVRQTLLIPDQALRLQGPNRVEVDPEFTGEVLRACHETALSLVDVHTHPYGSGPVAFSAHDEQNMLLTHTGFQALVPQGGSGPAGTRSSSAGPSPSR